MNNNINTKPSSLKPIFPPTKRPPEEQLVAESLHKNIVDTPTHFETDYISMKWIPEKRRIDVVWKQFVGEEKVREVLLKEVAMIRHTKVKCLFLDAQKFKGTNPNIPRWANEVWSQMVHDAGLKHFATVVSDKDIFAVFSLKYGMGEKLTSLINCAVFKTIEEGEVWLRQYTHPESPVYTDDELEEIMEEYENPVQETTIVQEQEEIYDNETVIKEEILANEKEEHGIPMMQDNPENIAQVIHSVSKEAELPSFDLTNEIVLDEEVENDMEEENTDTKPSQIQVFSNFEDLENHIQDIESKYNDDQDSENKELD